jgi:hypothetical protein
VPNNIYGIPDEALDRIRERDRACVYCHTIMRPYGSDGPSSHWATIEHLNHLPPWDDPTTIAICCAGCNSRRSNLTHAAWFATDYCRSRGISEESVAETVRNFLRAVQPE